MMIGDGAKFPIVFDGKKTPFTPISDLGYPMQDRQLYVYDADSISRTKSVYKETYAASSGYPMGIPLRSFANCPYGIAVYVRAKVAASTMSVLMSMYNPSPSTYIGYTAATITTSYGSVYLGTITPAQMADPNFYNGNLYFGTNGNVSGTLSVDGFWFVPVSMGLSVLTAVPSNPYQGMIVIADRATWDPMSKGSGGPYPVWYNGSAWALLSGQ